MSLPLSERIACSISDAKSMTGIGHTKIYELIKEGKIETTKIGTKRLVLIDSLRRLLQPSSQEAA